MTNGLTLYFLRKIRAQEYMSESEHDHVCYFLEVLFINVFKSVQVYALAWLFGTLLETFIMNFAYVVLRTHAGGWHAKSSTNCSLFGIVVFIGIPWILQSTHYTFSHWFAVILSIIILIGVWRYAPADTEKNPLVSISERRKKRYWSLISALMIILISFLKQNGIVQTLLLSGLLTETIIISTLFYKLTRRSYKNYEKYIQEK